MFKKYIDKFALGMAFLFFLTIYLFSIFASTRIKEQKAIQQKFIPIVQINVFYDTGKYKSSFIDGLRIRRTTYLDNKTISQIDNFIKTSDWLRDSGGRGW